MSKFDSPRQPILMLVLVHYLVHYLMHCPVHYVVRYQMHYLVHYLVHLSGQQGHAVLNSPAQHSRSFQHSRSTAQPSTQLNSRFKQPHITGRPKNVTDLLSQPRNHTQQVRQSVSESH